MKFQDYENKVLLNTNELLHYLNISRSKLYTLIKDGTIIAYKIDENMKGTNLFKFEEVKKILVKVPINENINKKK